MFSKRFEKAAFKTAVKENVKTLYRKTIDEATPQQLFQAVSYAVKDVIIDDWIETQKRYDETDAKTVYYMSMEFLMGRALGNNLINMTAYKDVKEALEDLRSFVDIGEATITESQTEDKDWINNWKKYFTSFTIDDILIKPTWEELKEEDKDKFLIEIDPGISFGTGKHETTQLCIRQLQKYVEGKHPKVLDVGCGSGILSIVALKLGAREVVGTDLDADCMTSTRDNMQVNHLDLSLGTFYVGNLIDDEELQEKVGTEEYEIVVANILAPVIIAMAPVIPARLKQGGYFITSGIIDFKENEVKEAIEAAGLTVVEINHQGEWVNITAQKQ